MYGIVKFYNEGKGFGFIVSENGEEIFVHITGLQPAERLQDGSEVIFDITEGERGLKADNVRLAVQKDRAVREKYFEGLEANQIEPSTSELVDVFEESNVEYLKVSNVEIQYSSPLSLFFDLDSIDAELAAKTVLLLSELYGESLDIVKFQPLPPGAGIFDFKYRKAG